MITLGTSAAAGFLVGLLYAAVDVRSPAPPFFALAGLLGMLVGEELGQGLRGWVAARAAPPVASTTEHPEPTHRSDHDG